MHQHQAFDLKLLAFVAALLPVEAPLCAPESAAWAKQASGRQAQAQAQARAQRAKTD